MIASSSSILMFYSLIVSFCVHIVYVNSSIFSRSSGLATILSGSDDLTSSILNSVGSIVSPANFFLKMACLLVALLFYSTSFGLNSTSTGSLFSPDFHSSWVIENSAARAGGKISA